MGARPVRVVTARGRQAAPISTAALTNRRPTSGAGWRLDPLDQRAGRVQPADLAYTGGARRRREVLRAEVDYEQVVADICAERGPFRECDLDACHAVRHQS